MGKRRSRTSVKRRQRDNSSRPRIPDTSDKTLSREELKTRSHIPEEVLAYALQTGLIPGATRISGKGRGVGAAFTFHDEHIRSCARIQQVRQAGGDYTLAALHLMLDGYLPPSADWIRRALVRVIVRSAGPTWTVGQLRRFVANQQLSAERITEIVEQNPTHSEQDARRFTALAHHLSPTRSAAPGIPRAKEHYSRAARLAIGHRGAGDAAYPDLSLVRLMDRVERAPDDLIWCAYRNAQRIVTRCARQFTFALRTAPSTHGQSDAELVEQLLPFPGLFAGLGPVKASMPVIMLGLLLDPDMRGVEALAAAFDVLGALRALPAPEPEDAQGEEWGTSDEDFSDHWLPPAAISVDSALEGGPTAN